MNRQRRKRIEKISMTLEDLFEEIQALQEEEQEAYDNMPEALQSSERGDAISGAIGNLESAASSLEEASEYLAAAIE